MGMTMDGEFSQRYDRQVRFAPLGALGQSRLQTSRVLVVGLGGVGSWLSEILVRAGVGHVRLVDDDVVDETNLARQAMYTEADSRAAKPKVEAAAAALRAMNSSVTLDPIRNRVTRETIDALAGDVDLLLDGTDDWATRFLLNDYAVRTGKAWLFAGAVAAEGQIMPIVPGLSACLRCVFEMPPPAAVEQANKASSRGVLAPVVATIAAMQAGLAIQYLAAERNATGDIEAFAFAKKASLRKIDLWTHEIRQISTATPREDCPCCQRREFPFADGRLDETIPAPTIC